MPSSSGPPTEPTFASAEEWLAERGVPRDPIRVREPRAPSAPEAGTTHRGPRPSAREAARLATEAPPPAPPEPPPSEEPGGNLEDEVARALAFVRRSTAAQPAAEDRLRRKLADRDTPRVVVDRALTQARREGLVDDRALVAALVEERRAKGHALPRIRRDLRRRELPADLVDAALARYEDEDPEAVAFGVARAQAPRYAGLDEDKALRRLVGFLVRRGFAEGLARKVGRQVVWVDREHERTAGH